MPGCKNNSKKSYTGKEPSPKGLGFCASGEKEGTVMKGLDGNMWIKSNDKWIKKSNTAEYEKLLYKKLFNWWKKLSSGNIIIIYKDNTWKLIKSTMKTTKSQINDIVKKWNDFDNDNEIKGIIWSGQSIDTIYFFVQYLIKKTSKNKFEELLKIKNLPVYLIENYKKYFRKNKIYTGKDFTFKS